VIIPDPVVFSSKHLNFKVMKKLLLLVLLSISIHGIAQVSHEKFLPNPAGLTNHFSKEFTSTNALPGPGPLKTPVLKPSAQHRDFNFVNPIAIGQAGNAFGFAFMRTTYLWADNHINTVTFIHRMINPPGTGYLAYDISKNGGQTWTNNVQTYDPTMEDAYDARYPQGAIYNPEGNTNPDQAYFHYFAPTLDGSNTGAGTEWGGYAYGVKQLAPGSAPTEHNQTSEPPYYQYLPSAFTITQTGTAWMVDENTQGAADEFNYLGDLIIGRGTWEEAESDFEYIFDLLPLEVNSEDGINDIKIAFAPDGLTGYICVMTNLPVTLPYTSYHPVLFKTTDGGDSWSDPIEVQLGGEDGLAEVREFISDSTLAWFYDPDPVPPRNEIPYYMGYECDLAVDAWGNPHISGMVCIANLEEGLIYTAEGLIAMFHIWSDDQGETWRAFNRSDLKRCRAHFGSSTSGISQFNRPQVATTMDGAIVFFSWLDTESPEIEDNSQPDIYFREYLPTLDGHGEEAQNVTFFSAAMWQAYFGCMSHYVFSDVTDNTYTCTIPFVYTQMTANDPLQPVQFYYIPDFVQTYVIIGINEPDPGKQLDISQNYPNPFSAKTYVDLNMLKESAVSLCIYDLTGNLVREYNLGKLTKGIHQAEISADDLSKGVYFYSVNNGQGKVTRKMIVM